MAVRYYPAFGGAGSCNCEGDDIPLNTTNFDNNLSVTDDNVQTAMDTLDDMLIDISLGGVLPIQIYRSDTEPVVGSAGIAMWEKTNTAQFFLIYRDTDSSQVLVELNTYTP